MENEINKLVTIIEDFSSKMEEKHLQLEKQKVFKILIFFQDILKEQEEKISFLESIITEKDNKILEDTIFRN